MAQFRTIYLANELLGNMFNGSTPYTYPSTLYIALFTVAPADNGTGGTECPDSSYARYPVAIPGSPANFTTASGGSVANAVAFPIYTPSSSTASLVAVGIYDALTSGHLLYAGTLSGSVTPVLGTPYGFPIGDLVVSEIFTSALPVITSSGTVSGSHSTTWTSGSPLYGVAASNSPSSFGAVNLPSGLAIDSGTGKITGTVAAGTYTAIVWAQNTTGQGFTVLTITIS